MSSARFRAAWCAVCTWFGSPCAGWAISGRWLGSVGSQRPNPLGAALLPEWELRSGRLGMHGLGVCGLMFPPESYAVLGLPRLTLVGGTALTLVAYVS